jgi:hypothetical protein
VTKLFHKPLNIPARIRYSCPSRRHEKKSSPRSRQESPLSRHALLPHTAKPSENGKMIFAGFRLRCNRMKLFAAIRWFLRLLVQSRSQLVLENLALRQQLAVLSRQRPRPALQRRDRLFWVCLSKWWTGWRSVLIVVQPDTVIRWHQQGFRL